MSLTAAEPELSPARRGAGDEVRARLREAQSIPQMIERLATILGEGRYKDDQAISVAIGTTMTILQDGAATVYSEQRTYYAMFAPATIPWDEVRDVAVADADGAFVGAVGGCVAGMLAAGAGCGPAALAGGVAAAVANSAKEVVTKFMRRLTRR